MQELCFKEGSEILAFFQAEKGRENRFIVLLGGSTGCRTELPPHPQWHHRLTFFLFLFLPLPRFLLKLQQNPLLPESGSGSGLGRHLVLEMR